NLAQRLSAGVQSAIQAQDRIVEEPAIRRVLSTRDSATLEEVRALLAMPSSPQRVEVWSAAGERVFELVDSARDTTGGRGSRAGPRGRLFVRAGDRDGGPGGRAAALRREAVRRDGSGRCA